MISDRISDPESITRQLALEILRADDSELPALVESSRHTKAAHFGSSFQFCSIINARSGACNADCKFCAQSSFYKTGAPVYGLVSQDDILAGARLAEEAGAVRYGIVTSGTAPAWSDLLRICEAVREIRRTLRIIPDCSIGIVNNRALSLLKEAGIDRIHHNLETSREFYPQISSVYKWDDKFDYIKRVKAHGFSLCSGGIFGMGESDEDIVSLAWSLKDVSPESIPINFLVPIEGTPLMGQGNMTPGRALRIVILFRLLFPSSEVRLCGGRETHLLEFERTALSVADSAMVGGYLTRPQRPPAEDRRLIEDLGCALVRPGEILLPQ
ncbi:MAG: biotin synthase BioB [Candidatus Sumerlaeia bacterium]